MNTILVLIFRDTFRDVVFKYKHCGGGKTGIASGVRGQ